MTEQETLNELASRSSDYDRGFRAAIRIAWNIARRDLRSNLAKNYGYVPAWQKGRWMVADELSALAVGEDVMDKEGKL